MNIETSPRFRRSFGKVSDRIQKKAIERVRIFATSDGRDPRLGTHKLHGKQDSEWSFSVDYSYRITFIFSDNGSVLLLDIGTHDELYC